MAVELPRCACGCGATLTRRGPRGPAPQYASAVCRKRAERRRRAVQELEPWTEVVHAAAAPVAPTPTDDQVARAVLETRAVGFALLRLGSQARPELAWRCTKLGEQIVAALNDTFGEMSQ